MSAAGVPGEAEEAGRLSRTPAELVVDAVVALDCKLVTADRPFFEAQQGGPQGDRLLWVADPL